MAPQTQLTKSSPRNDLRREASRPCRSGVNGVVACIGVFADHCTYLFYDDLGWEVGAVVILPISDVQHSRNF